MVVDVGVGIGEDGIVAVGEGDVFAAGVVESVVAGWARALVGLGDDADEVWVLLLVACENLWGLVGGAVVDADDLVGRLLGWFVGGGGLEVLVEEGVEAARKEVRAVIDGDDDGEQRGHWVGV